MTTHLTEDDLVLHYYSEGRTSWHSAVAEHLEGCAECHRAYLDLVKVLTIVGHTDPPEPPEDFEANLWSRLRPRLSTVPRHSWFRIVTARWVLAGAAAAVVLLAFLAGRQWPASPGAPPGAEPTRAASVRDRILLVAVGDHLERSQLVLVELMNRNPDQSLDISSEQASARELVASNRLYRQSAAHSGEMGVESVLDELEPILLEIANSPSTLSSFDFEQMRQRIEDQGILFRVHVLESRVRARERVAGRGPARLASERRPI